VVTACTAGAAGAEPACVAAEKGAAPAATTAPFGRGLCPLSASKTPKPIKANTTAAAKKYSRMRSKTLVRFLILRNKLSTPRAERAKTDALRS
jgi:hypothetical protein